MVKSMLGTTAVFRNFNIDGNIVSAKVEGAPGIFIMLK